MNLGSATIERGFTISSPDDELRVAIRPKTVGESAIVRLRALDEEPAAPDGMRRASDIWVYDAVKSSPKSTGPLTLRQPLTISLRYESATLYRKRVFFWDRNKTQWIAVPSSVDTSTGRVLAALPLPYAAVAVFEDRQAVEGKASWFRHKYSDTAASNDYPMGSKLRVTDLDTRNTVTVIVRSRGPFVHGRVIDLARTAFKQLRPTSQGVAVVRVELLDD